MADSEATVDLKQAATSAYRQDGREPGWCSQANADSGWHPRLDRLRRGGYSYLGYHFSDHGVLFRGMPGGFLAALAEGQFWHGADEAMLCRLERELDVIFCSETARDALAVAKPWQTKRDAAVLVFNSSIFAARWQKRAAAVLGFADVGMVFKYPCLAEPLLLSELSAVLVAPEIHAEANRLLAGNPENAAAGHLDRMLCTLSGQAFDQREEWNSALEMMITTHGFEAAAVETCDIYPGCRHSDKAGGL